MTYIKKIKKEVRPCLNCGENYMIFNRSKWLCKECDQERRKERKGDLASLFLEIWAERDHVCEECGVHLGDEPKLIFFSHRKSRGAYPELRLDKDNIDLLCSACHRLRDFNEIEK